MTARSPDGPVPGRHEQDLLREDPARRREEQVPPDPATEAIIQERQSARLRHEFELWWRTLDEEQILDLASRRDELLALLNEKYGYARHEAETVIEEAMKGLAGKYQARQRGR